MGISCADCVALNTIDYISFSDNFVLILRIACSYQHTCVLFENQRMICFGRSQYGQVGAGVNTNISGPSPGPALATQPLIDFADNSNPILDIVAQDTYSCAIRCDRSIVCFGTNFYGQLGQALPQGAVIGDAPGEVVALSPMPLRASLYHSGASLLSLVLSTGAAPNLACSAFHNLVVVDAKEISIVSYNAVYRTNQVPLIITVNGGPMDTKVPLKPHIANVITIVSTTYDKSNTRTYILSVRSLLSADVTLGENNGCYLTAGRIVCWGVGRTND